MKHYSKYKYVYDNWYVVSCKKIDEAPVNFDTYFRIVPEHEMEQLRELLNKGITP